jgi:hypothetical protein
LQDAAWKEYTKREGEISASEVKHYGQTCEFIKLYIKILNLN